MKLTSFGGDDVGHAEIDAGHDHEPDHDPGGLHHLPAIWPLYPLELSPASLQEADQPDADQARRARSGTARQPSAGRARRPPPSPAPPPESVAAVLVEARCRRTSSIARRSRRARLAAVVFARPDPAVPSASCASASSTSGAACSSGRRRQLERRSSGSRVEPRRLPRSVRAVESAAGARTAASPLLRAFAVAGHGLLGHGSSRLAVRGVAPAPAAVLAQLQPLRVVPLALVRLVVPALALFAGEGGSDPDVSTGHCALLDEVIRDSATEPRASELTPPGAGAECSGPPAAAGIVTRSAA